MVVLVRVVTKGSASGMPIELPDAHVVTLHDGRLTSTCVYRDRSEALEAPGSVPKSGALARDPQLRPIHDN